MNDALEHVLEAYRILLFKPHKLPEEKRLMESLYLTVYKLGNAAFRKRAEVYKIEKKDFFEGNEKKSQQVTLLKESKEPFQTRPTLQDSQSQQPETQQPAKQEENVVEVKKRGRKAKNENSETN